LTLPPRNAKNWRAGDQSSGVFSKHGVWTCPATATPAGVNIFQNFQPASLAKATAPGDGRTPNGFSKHVLGRELMPACALGGAVALGFKVSFFSGLFGLKGS
jgi:hypothetical protein